MNYRELLKLVEEMAVPLAKAPTTHRIPLGKGITGGRLPPVDKPIEAPRLKDGSPEAREAMGRIMGPDIKNKFNDGKSAAYNAGLRDGLRKLGFLPVVSGTLGIAESLANSAGEPVHIRAGKAGMTGLGAMGGNIAGSAIGGTLGGLTMGPLGALGGMLVGGVTGSTIGAMAGHKGTGLAIESIEDAVNSLDKSNGKPVAKPDDSESEKDDDKPEDKKHKRKTRKKAQAHEALSPEAVNLIMRLLGEGADTAYDAYRVNKLVPKSPNPEKSENAPLPEAAPAPQPSVLESLAPKAAYDAGMDYYIKRAVPMDALRQTVSSIGVPNAHTLPESVLRRLFIANSRKASGLAGKADHDLLGQYVGRPAAPEAEPMASGPLQTPRPGGVPPWMKMTGVGLAAVLAALASRHI